MLNFLLFSLVFCFSLGMFDLSTSYSEVVTAFTGLGKASAETSVLSFDEQGSVSKPYFAVNLFISNVEAYFASSLPKSYVENSLYYLSFHFFRDEDGVKGLEVKNKPTGAQVTFSCPVSCYFTYQNAMTFHVVRGIKSGN